MFSKFFEAKGETMKSKVMSTALAFVLTSYSGLAYTSAAAGAEYPFQPVKIITQGSAGSGPDVITRIVADRLSRLWGQQVVVINQAGGGGSIAARTAAAAVPDGYTLYMPAASAFVAMNAELQQPIDMDRLFTPIGLIGETPMVFVASTTSGIESLPMLIEAAKRKPGEISFAGTIRGGMPHLAGALLQSRAGIQLSFIPYQGAPQALHDVIGGRIPVMVEGVGALSGALSGGQVRSLAVASRERLRKFPDVPAVAETLAGFEARGWYALVATSGVPSAVLKKVGADLRSVLENADVRAQFETLGTYARPLSPEETVAFIKGEQELWRPLLENFGKAQ
jgi:tripartite-type tricarboxylate transporter receptor subunit TctC